MIARCGSCGTPWDFGAQEEARELRCPECQAKLVTPTVRAGGSCAECGKAFDRGHRAPSCDCGAPIATLVDPWWKASASIGLLIGFIAGVAGAIAAVGSVLSRIPEGTGGGPLLPFACLFGSAAFFGAVAAGRVLGHVGSALGRLTVGVRDAPPPPPRAEPQTGAARDEAPGKRSALGTLLSIVLGLVFSIAGVSLAALVGASELLPVEHRLLATIVLACLGFLGGMQGGIVLGRRLVP